MYSAFQSNNDKQDVGTFSLDDPGMSELVATAALNSRIKFDRTDIDFASRQIMGDATETGLARFAGRSLADYDAYLREYTKVFEVPFNAVNKWALVIVNRPHNTGRFVSYIKGAPERVLAKCTTRLKDGKAIPIDNVYKESYEAAYNVCILQNSGKFVTYSQFLVHGFTWSPRNWLCAVPPSRRHLSCGFRILEEEQ